MTWTTEFKHLYIPAHMNAGSYFIGIVAGFVVHKLRAKTITPREKRILGYMFWLVPTMGVLNMEVSNIFYFFEFEKPAVWIAVFSIVSRIIWGLIGFVLIFAAIFKASTFVNKVFNAPIFQPLGRITYCIYLVHMPIMRVLGGGNKGVVHISNSLFVSFFIISTKNEKLIINSKHTVIKCRILLSRINNCWLYPVSYARISDYRSHENVD